MNIVIYVKYIYPDKLGGVEKHVDSLASCLHERGHNVKVICMSNGKHYRKQYDIKYFNLLKFILSSYNISADVVHYHGYRDPLIALSMLFCNNNNIIFTPHAIFPNKSIIDRITKIIYDNTLGFLSLKCPKKIIALNEDNKAELLNLTPKNNSISIIPNLVLLKEFFVSADKNVFRDKYEINKPYILYVGRISWHKGIFLLLNLNCVAKIMGINIVLIGKMEKFFENTINFESYESVIYLGCLDRSDILSAYAGCMCFVLPSMHEGLSTVMLEAMASKKIVVINNKACGNVITNMNNGLTFDNEKELAKIISNISNYDIKSITDSAYDTAKAYSWEKNIILFEKLYYL